MIDLNQILADMAAAIRSDDFPNGSEIASTLGLDLSMATITTTQSDAIAIIGARLPALSAPKLEWRALRRLARHWIWFSSTRRFPLAPMSKRP